MFADAVHQGSWVVALVISVLLAAAAICALKPALVGAPTPYPISDGLTYSTGPVIWYEGVKPLGYGCLRVTAVLAWTVPLPVTYTAPVCLGNSWGTEDQVMAALPLSRYPRVADSPLGERITTLDQFTTPLPVNTTTACLPSTR